MYQCQECGNEWDDDWCDDCGDNDNLVDLENDDEDDE